MTRADIAEFKKIVEEELGAGEWIRFDNETLIYRLDQPREVWEGLFRKRSGLGKAYSETVKKKIATAVFVNTILFSEELINEDITTFYFYAAHMTPTRAKNLIETTLKLAALDWSATTEELKEIETWPVKVDKNILYVNAVPVKRTFAINEMGQVFGRQEVYHKPKSVGMRAYARVTFGPETKSLKVADDTFIFTLEDGTTVLHWRGANVLATFPDGSKILDLRGMQTQTLTLIKRLKVWGGLPIEYEYTGETNKYKAFIGRTRLAGSTLISPTGELHNGGEGVWEQLRYRAPRTVAEAKQRGVPVTRRGKWILTAKSAGQCERFDSKK